MDVPRAGLRPRLIAPGAVLLLAYGFESALAAGRPRFGWDLPVERAVQSFGWGVLVDVMRIFDRVDGLWQVGLAVVAIAAVFVFNRPATGLVVAGALSSAVYYLTQLEIHRARPDAHLVHVLRHAAEGSYPSGHAVFFTWLAVLVPVALRPVWRGWWLLAVLLALVMLLASIGRLVVGEHWPSDVLGGVLLGLGWSLLVLGVRPLSEPVLG